MSRKPIIKPGFVGVLLFLPLGCLTPSASKVVREDSCLQAYARFYRDPVIDIRVLFGYKDTRPLRFVGDRYERNTFVEQLTGPCLESETACAFSRSADDGDRFEKKIVIYDGTTRTVQISVSHSSVGPDDDENLKDSYQKWQSEVAQTNFFSGLEMAHAIFYHGHSRNGGGPDFSPPVIRPDGHVDYGRYMKEKPGVAPMLAAIQKRKNPGLLALLSCISSGHFAQTIEKTDPQLALITHRKLLYYDTGRKSLMGALNALLGNWCQPGFDNAICEKGPKGQACASPLDPSLIHFF